MPQSLDTRHVLRQIARGERQVSDLSLIGINLESERVGDAVRHRSAGRNAAHVANSLKDIAAGLLAHSKDSETLRDWATALLVIDAFDIAELDVHPDFDILWGAVWDASFSGKVTEDAIMRARRLMQQGQKTG